MHRFVFILSYYGEHASFLPSRPIQSNCHAHRCQSLNILNSVVVVWRTREVRVPVQLSEYPDAARMKFASVLREGLDILPDTEDLFKKYKHLKKSLKRFSDATQGSGAGPRGSGVDVATPSTSPNNAGKLQYSQILDDEEGQMEGKRKQHPAADGEEEEKGAKKTRAAEDDANAAMENMEARFIAAITSDVMDLNEKYIEKEEDFIIAWGNIEEKMSACSTKEDKIALYSDLVDFHGNLVMLLHWSMLAYTGLVKILKKHYKRTGLTVNAPHLKDLLRQPFCSVGMACNILSKAEEVALSISKDLGMDPVLPTNVSSLILANKKGMVDLASEDVEEDLYPIETASAIERAKTALQTWNVLQKTAATPSTGIARETGGNAKQSTEKLDELVTDSSAV